MSTWTKISLLAAVLAVALAMPAAAATDDTSVTLTSGPLEFTDAPGAANFAATQLTGDVETLNTTFDNWSVNDARGSGAGWHVTVQASQFSTGVDGDTLPVESLSLKAPTLITAANLLNLAGPPALTSSGPWTIDGASAVKVVSAAADKGQGEWDFTQANLLGGDLTLTVPADAAAGTYTSTITTTLATGP